MNANGLSMRRPARWLVPALVAIAAVTVASDTPAKEKKDSKSKSSTIKIKDDGGYLGVYMQELTDEMRKGLDIDASRSGVLISGVEEGSPADKAGIDDGDVIVKVDGKAVSSPDELRDAVRGHEPGSKTTLDVWQDGKSRTVTVTVGDRPERHEVFISPDMDFDVQPHIEHAFAMMGGPRLGVEARELDDEGLASYFGAKPGEGVLVLGVDEESVAGKAGVKAGDIIRQIGEDKVTEIRDIKDAVREFDEGDDFTITVQRHGKNQELKATMDEQSNTFTFRAPRAMRWHNDVPGTPRAPRAPRTPRVYTHEMQRGRAEMQQQLDDMKEQIEELKEQLERQDG